MEGFNPRALRGARRHAKSIYAAPSGFQSTRPARGATYCAFAASNPVSCFNPRALRGARQGFRGVPAGHLVFQSTRPARGATKRVSRFQFHLHVSIHAPCAGRDMSMLMCLYLLPCFNPRALRGARLPVLKRWLMSWLFQSTRPARGATRELATCACELMMFQSTRPARGATYVAGSGDAPFAVSIHAPCAGRDCTISDINSTRGLFQSTRPARGAT